MKTKSQARNQNNMKSNLILIQKLDNAETQSLASLLAYQLVSFKARQLKSSKASQLKKPEPAPRTLSCVCYISAKYTTNICVHATYSVSLKSFTRRVAALEVRAMKHSKNTVRKSYCMECIRSLGRAYSVRSTLRQKTPI